ncbi:DUF1254 domain-containing protein [Flavobacterium artemisiae]|uniref:DUF1254 domain-containing protein n=1 Tax=Flavobacterium artemisiae TaxID=2126556 RepID=A0ABW4HDD2_9FLAO
MKKVILLLIITFLSCNSNKKESDTVHTEPTASDSAKTIVPGPVPDVVMTKEYVYQLGKQMYFWGWPLMNMHNRVLVMRQVPEPGLNGGAVPVAPVNHLCMTSDYITPAERYVACPNQDVVYGFGIMLLNESPVVIQVPDFGDRFWVVQLGNQRTDGIARLGAMYGSKKGFYLIAGPGWKGEVPDGITEVFRSDTNLAFVIPRAFLNNTPEDKAAIQHVINQLMAYPLSEYDGKAKTKEWAKVPSFPDPNKSEGGKEVAFVVPEKFFAEFPDVLKEVPAMRGEEGLYGLFNSVMNAVKKDSTLMPVLIKAAVDAEKELIEPLRQFKNVGVPVGNYWNTTKNGAAFGTDYLSRTSAARANIFVNQPQETIYYNQDLDSKGVELNGNTNYTITFPKDLIPKVKGFWSLTVYDSNHFFFINESKIYSLGTKNKNLKYNPDGSLTIYFQNAKPSGDKSNNWLPVPKGKFGLLLRAYWPEENMIKGYTPPGLVKS